MVVIIKSGRMPSLPDRRCSFCCRPLFRSLNPHEIEPSIGEPCAGDPPARFGGKGCRIQWAFPTPVLFSFVCDSGLSGQFNQRGMKSREPSPLRPFGL